MLRLMKPKYFMPVHGEFRMLKIHARSLKIQGFLKKIALSWATAMLALTADSARPAGHFNANDVYVDGKWCR